MIEFTIIYIDKSKKKKTAKNREELIRDFSLNDATEFQEKVKEIHWTIDDLHYIENIASGKIQEIEIFEGKQDFK